MSEHGISHGVCMKAVSLWVGYPLADNMMGKWDIPHRLAVTKWDIPLQQHIRQWDIPHTYQWWPQDERDIPWARVTSLELIRISLKQTRDIPQAEWDIPPGLWAKWWVTLSQVGYPTGPTEDMRERVSLRYMGYPTWPLSPAGSGPCMDVYRWDIPLYRGH
jgi:hypothetical protein